MGALYASRVIGVRRFLHEHLPKHLKVLWPFHKPEGWFECRDYLNQRREPTLARVLALPQIPDASTAPGSTQPRPDPPTSDRRSQMMDALEQEMQKDDPNFRIVRQPRLPPSAEDMANLFMRMMLESEDAQV